MYFLNELFDRYTLPASQWIQEAVTWLVIHLRPLFIAIRQPIAICLDALDHFLRATPAVLFLVLLGLIAWSTGGRRLAGWVVAGFLLIGFLGLWDMAMTTVAMMLTSVIFCGILVGLPLGDSPPAATASSTRSVPSSTPCRPRPLSSDLVPIVMLFGIGNVPAVLATIVVALPPMIRLTSLGIREVDPNVVEALAMPLAVPDSRCCGRSRCRWRCRRSPPASTRR